MEEQYNNEQLEQYNKEQFEQRERLLKAKKEKRALKKKLSEKDAKKNWYQTPHKFEEIFGLILKPQERAFYYTLLRLQSRYGIKTGDRKGWFSHQDKKFTTKKGKELGMWTYGYDTRFCKRMREKLVKLELLEFESRRTGGYNDGFNYRPIWPKNRVFREYPNGQ